MFVPFAETKIAPFRTYADIPELTKEYILYVVGEKDLETIPLEDINSFIIMIHDAEKLKRDEWEDGWVL
jgi:hypothetical protein